ncbi:MAG: hypothetical protein KKF33_05605, partial [Alphaproteobacteria bacterium]|nr:hypothetical protein [Alphaproteobacteria bacterium]
EMHHPSAPTAPNGTTQPATIRVGSDDEPTASRRFGGDYDPAYGGTRDTASVTVDGHAVGVHLPVWASYGFGDVTPED